MKKGMSYLNKKRGNGSRSAVVPANTDASGIPALADNKSSCCGCGACYAVCPVGAIEMKADEEGFLYPVIDAGKCVRCRKCVQACAFKRDQGERG